MLKASQFIAWIERTKVFIYVFKKRVVSYKSMYKVKNQHNKTAKLLL
jgi:hypothetical protein